MGVWPVAANQSPRPRSLIALIELGTLFLPGIPAFFWLWPRLSGPAADAAQVVAYLYLLAGGLVIGLRRWTPYQLGLSRRGLWLGVACGLALLAGRTLIILAVSWPQAAAPLTLRRAISDLLFYFGLVGLVEEYLFRGLVYRALLEWRSVRWAVWGSALAFSLFHVGWHSPLQALGSLIYGLILGVARWRTGGILGLILAHGMMDLGAVWLLPMLRLEEIGRPGIAHPALLLVGCALLFGTPLYLWLLHPRLKAWRP